MPVRKTSAARTTKSTAKPKAQRQERPPLRIAVPGKDKPVERPSLVSVPDQPGVFLNSAGFRVDKNGVLLRFADAARAEKELDEQILGESVDSPAKLLKRVALDPRMPMAWRLDAAKAAAPYFDKKTPVAVENTNTDLRLDATAIARLPREKRIELLKTLAELGVDINIPDSAKRTAANE